MQDGNIAYYTCGNCEKFFADEDGKTQLTADQLGAKGAHAFTYHKEIAPVGKTDGTAAYYDCSVCMKKYADEEGKTVVTEKDLVIQSVLNIPDFLVEVEEGKDPVVLQLSDPQLCNWGDVETYCYEYIRETVAETKPDLIIITGDLVYGRFDPNGDLLKSLIAFMESLQIPWAPVFGNHDNESLKGVDWQCAQLEAAEYCLFEQGDLTGNCNYSIGIAQGDKLLRVFYMLDSNGCGQPMCNEDGVQTQPAAGTNVVKTSAGFGQDQIDWYTNEISAIHAKDASVKISFAYHIQQAIFEKAFKKYSEYDGLASSSVLTNPLNLDTLETADETDFGYLGRAMKGAWDTSYAIFNGMKALGVDSIFVGHEHCNSVSIVYEGVRFQFSQKSSRYDRYNSVNEDGSITGNYGHDADAHPLMGGTVIPVSSVDGSIGTGYIYYVGNPFYFEPKPEPVPVNGLEITKSMLASGITAYPYAYDDTVNAYKVYSEGQNKIFFDIAMAVENNYFTFTALIPEDSAGGVSHGDIEFWLRVKPTNNLPGSNGSYIEYHAPVIPRGVWKTFVVDITSVGADCTEFSIMFSEGTTIWLRDIAFTQEEPLIPGEIRVNGEKISESDIQYPDRMTFEAKAFDENTNAYYITSTVDSGKVYLSTAKAGENNVFTFSAYLAEDTGTSSFGLRVKPDGTIFTSEQGTLSADGKYIWFNLKKGAWVEVTVDISQIGDNCTEFAFTTMNGLKVWIKDVAFSKDMPSAPATVNGIQLTTENLQDPSKVTLEAKMYDENTMAYYITSEVNSSKIYLDTKMAAASSVFTFSACLVDIPDGSNFGIRVKPDGTEITASNGVFDGKYLWFSLKKGEWVTITVDISVIGDNCSEFAFTTMAGMEIWIKDIAFSNAGPTTVNGIQLTTENLQDPSKVTLEAKMYDDNTMAYHITSSVDSSKVYLDTKMAEANNTFTFSVCLVDIPDGKNLGIRVKPDGTEIVSDYGKFDGKYLWLSLKKGTWMTITVDISAIGEGCSEFSFTTMAGLEVWIKDIAFSMDKMPEKLTVNGVEVCNPEASILLSVVAFDETVNAYEVTATAQGKVFIMPSKVANKNTISFTVYVDETVATNTTVFMIRIKPNNLDAEDGNGYIYYTPSTVKVGEWQTFTVDISGFGEACTEFAFVIPVGQTIWLRDITIS